MEQNDPWADTAQQAIGALFSQYLRPRQQPQVNIPPELYGNGPAVTLPVFNNGSPAPVKAQPAGVVDPKIMHIQKLASQYGVDPSIATGVFGAESSFGKNIGPSKAGAIGPMQVMPHTMVNPGFGVKPAQNKTYDELARVGVEYLAAMKNKYGNYNDALVAYNWGPTNTDKWKRSGARHDRLPSETINYLRKVKGYSQ